MSVFKRGKWETGGARSEENMSIVNERRFLLSPDSDFYVTEAYKTLRTNVIFSLTDVAGCSVIVITSGFQHEGKSTTSSNLAISLAQADKKVLLVDCDLRKPKLSRLLDLNAPVGLSNILIDPNLLPNAIVHYKDYSMDVLLSGSIPPNPSELLASARMQQLITKLKGYYDFIILDTPPVNMVTDSVVLAPVADGFLLVVRAEQADRNSVSHALEQLEYAKARILGLILNGAAMEHGTYGYGKYGHYGYKYGYKYGYSGSSDGSTQKTK